MSILGPVAEPRVLPLAHGGELVIPRGQCLVMGILNATPDSFSDGGELDTPLALEARIRQMLEEGADILDVGGESTRPGHEPVSAGEELTRVLPVIEAIRRINEQIPISIDTRKTRVARLALEAGASLVNDVSGLGEPGMGRLVADAGCSIVLMRSETCHGDVVTSTRSQLQAAMVRARTSGIPDHCLVLDPGLGFGERPGASVEDNLALIDRIADYNMGRLVLIGASRKRFAGAMIGGAPNPLDRVEASVKLAVRAAQAGASIVRVHDVQATVQALAASGFRRTALG